MSTIVTIPPPGSGAQAGDNSDITALEAISTNGIKFNDGGSASVTISAPGTINASYNLTWPNAAPGNGNFLANSVGGTLTWSSGGGVSQSYVDSLFANNEAKTSAACATTVNITLSGEQTIDDVATFGSYVLVKDQTDPTENGLYLSGFGAWIRVVPYMPDNGFSAVGAVVGVNPGGTVNGNTLWYSTADGSGTVNFIPILLGTTNTPFAMASGVYLPTLTKVANLTATTAYNCQYMRVGAVVTVGGKADVTPTLTTTATTMGISLPIASTFAASENCGGSASAVGISGQSAGVDADTVNHRAQMQWKSVDITNQSMYFSFTYRII